MQYLMKVIDLYDMVTKIFNDPSFIPETHALPHLHSDIILV